MLRLYNAALLPARLLAAALALAQGTTPERRREWAERLGRRLPQPIPGGVWLHGASVGEARLVGSLAQGIRHSRPTLPLAVSAVTATGRAQLPAGADSPQAFFAPLDFRRVVQRVIGALQPSVLALVETELWPNLLSCAANAQVAVVVLNGRLSEKRMRRYRWARGLYRPLVHSLSGIGAQSEEDAARFVELGAPASRIEVTGNLKYDLAPPVADPATLRQRLRISPQRPVWVAGSTGPGEESLVLDAFAQARQSSPNLLLILAPRHPPRTGEVETLCRQREFGLCRLSALESPAGGLEEPEAIVLVDTVGHLSALYGIAQVAFVGGSLVPVGGHNLLEPAAWGVPVLFGPHTENFMDIAEHLLSGGGGRRVADAGDLGDQVQQLLGNPGERELMGQSGRGVLSRHRGALDKSVALVSRVLSQTPQRSMGVA